MDNGGNFKFGSSCDQNRPNQGGGGGPGAPPHQPSLMQQWITRPPVQLNRPAPPDASGNRSPQTSAPPQQSGAPLSSSIMPVQTPPSQTHALPSADQFEKPLSTLSEGRTEAMRRPDLGGTVKIREIRLLVNHFHVNSIEKTIFHYDVDIEFKPANDGEPMEKALTKSERRFIKHLLFNEQFADSLLMTAFDSEKNILSAVRLRGGSYDVDISEGEDVRIGTYRVTFKLVNELTLSKLNDYLGGSLNSIPRDTLHGMDLVMKENPKPTLQGPALFLDYSVLYIPKPSPVIQFLKDHLDFEDANDVNGRRDEVENSLKGLLVKVNHRRTNQKYTIAGLTIEVARDISFDIVDRKGEQPPKTTRLIEYFWDKWKKKVVYENIPCLELGKGQKSHKVPMEFCDLAEWQRFPKEKLDNGPALLLKSLPLVKKPRDRMNAIYEMVQANDRPYGKIAKNFGIELDQNMTEVMGRVIPAPELKFGNSPSVKVDDIKCRWNLVKRSFMDGRSLDRWAMIDFTEGKLNKDDFEKGLIDRCKKLGIRMEQPLVYRLEHMVELTSEDRHCKLDKLLRSVAAEANGKNKDKLQMILCVMTKSSFGYKNLKWLSETQIGVVTQCCLLPPDKGLDQWFANLCLNINAKLGGSNFELSKKLLEFDAQDHVLFIGADVNHPAPMNKSRPSIAAVVGTVNWPAANRYAARISPQAPRCEKINNFGALCLDLVKTYAGLNKDRPKRIVVFRDGVSDGKFRMVLNEELDDLKKAFHTDNYKPLITVIVAQRRHQTRFIVDGGQSGNVPPGTVVDQVIVHPHNFDFFLCSHYGEQGTRPAHYYVLCDDNSFTSDQLQKLIYDMCFTYAPCTSPVSLVPPVYYADLVAHRGRLYQEVVRENELGNSFDQKLYKLHKDLENVMFFV